MEVSLFNRDVIRLGVGVTDWAARTGGLLVGNILNFNVMMVIRMKVRGRQ
ncbi:MAG: hypothetical protein AB8B91_13655 [Rubripirellula sp.]